MTVVNLRGKDIKETSLDQFSLKKPKKKHERQIMIVPRVPDNALVVTSVDSENKLLVHEGKNPSDMEQVMTESQTNHQRVVVL